MSEMEKDSCPAGAASREKIPEKLEWRLFKTGVRHGGEGRGKVVRPRDQRS